MNLLILWSNLRNLTSMWILSIAMVISVIHMGAFFETGALKHVQRKISKFINTKDMAER